MPSCAYRPRGAPGVCSCAVTRVIVQKESSGGCYGVDSSLACREHLLKTAPAISDHLGYAPAAPSIRAAAVRESIVPVPDQGPIWTNGIDDTIAAGEDSREAPSSANGHRGLPVARAVVKAVMLIPDQLIVLGEGVEAVAAGRDHVLERIPSRSRSPWPLPGCSTGILS